MGTNFYLQGEQCSHCGQELPSKPRRHIGKSSAGWAFGLHVYPDEGIHELWDWAALWDAPGARIEDEYGRPVTPYEMLKIVVFKRQELRQNDKFNHAENQSEPTYNGLVRPRLKGQYCDGHGHATWSKFAGDFS